MYALLQTQPELLEVFDHSTPGMPMLFSMLEGRSPADIRVDDPAKPTQCVIRNGVRLTFASRGVSQAFLEEALADLRRSGGVSLVDGRESTLDWEPPTGATVIERAEYRSLDVEKGGFHDVLHQPLDDVTLRLVDRESFDRCLWKEILLAFCGTPEGFLRHGFGLSLGRGEDILAEGYAAQLGRSTMEIGVMTAEAHRGNGYATQVSAHVIERCLRNGHSVLWSCELDNPASAAIARKLGFRDDRAYSVFAYRSTKP